ncbi:hypothetical protein PGTUg99_036191 [Puccinia graminis f. sp. tritici]|uniref:Uncharacterized protein n=1 Tax=Puccinia graminis f. sp. tritici TaxID=56615 RepID=A0A5B0PMD4_PUCGR|nr:hypothetical protein PGTUg99_036191 [Puccinia graminis f. sp. tritici]
MKNVMTSSNSPRKRSACQVHNTKPSWTVVGKEAHMCPPAQKSPRMTPKKKKAPRRLSQRIFQWTRTTSRDDRQYQKESNPNVQFILKPTNQKKKKSKKR